ncbi:GATA transcription factor 15-like [Typha latifolia]|uniref:GATA transcription factor 15-like n=1 Tax=Typha latifolia TaxID=4733 RepID=UPI003C2DFD1A
MLHQCRTHSNGGMAFSILFPMSDKQPIEEASNTHNSFTSSSVDCTLSLGTPSTRHTDAMEPKAGMAQHSSYVSTFCWDVIANSNKHQSMGSKVSTAVSNGSGSNLGADPHLLARRCANCDTTSTPLWRNGPRGPKSLCNACGIRYKKEERRAAATTSTASTSAVTAQQWGCYGSTAGKAPSVSMYGEDSSAEDGEVPYLSWRLNVVPPQPFPVRDRHSLFQYN